MSGCKAFDHQDRDTNMEFDAKNLTRNGCAFMPSNMLGQGRKFNQQEFIRKTSAMNYIICDIVDFPSIRIVFKKGTDLMEQFPKGKISRVKGRRKLFGS